MAPDAYISLHFAGFKLVMGVEGPVILLYMATEAKRQGCSGLSSAQEVAVGQGSRLSRLAARCDIVTAQAGEQSFFEGQIRGDSLGDCGAWRNIRRVALGAGEPPIVTRSA
jgi:hypothetical protein